MFYQINVFPWCIFKCFFFFGVGARGKVYRISLCKMNLCELLEQAITPAADNILLLFVENRFELLLFEDRCLHPSMLTSLWKLHHVICELGKVHKGCLLGSAVVRGYIQF